MTEALPYLVAGLCREQEDAEEVTGVWGFLCRKVLTGSASGKDQESQGEDPKSGGGRPVPPEASSNW